MRKHKDLINETHNKQPFNVRAAENNCSGDKAKIVEPMQNSVDSKLEVINKEIILSEFQTLTLT